MLREELASHRALAAEILGDCSAIRFDVPAAGIFFWIEVLDCPHDSRTRSLLCAEQHGVIVMPGAAFGVDRPMYLRASFAVPRDELDRGFQALVTSLGRC